MITVNDHHDVLHATSATKVSGSVRYNATYQRSEITLRNQDDMKPTMQALLKAGWVAQHSGHDRKTFYVVGAVVHHP